MLDKITILNPLRPEEFRKRTRKSADMSLHLLPFSLLLCMLLCIKLYCIICCTIHSGTIVIYLLFDSLFKLIVLCTVMIVGAIVRD